jgi:hypothetical protein
MMMQSAGRLLDQSQQHAEKLDDEGLDLVADLPEFDCLCELCDCGFVMIKNFFSFI